MVKNLCQTTQEASCVTPEQVPDLPTGSTQFSTFWMWETFSLRGFATFNTVIAYFDIFGRSCRSVLKSITNQEQTWVRFQKCSQVRAPNLAHLAPRNQNIDPGENRVPEKPFTNYGRLRLCLLKNKSIWNVKSTRKLRLLRRMAPEISEVGHRDGYAAPVTTFCRQFFKLD